MEQKSNWKSKANIVLLILITMVVLYFALREHFNETIDQILHLNIWWFFVAVFLYFGYLLFKSLALFAITKQFKEDHKYPKTVRLALTTQFFNAVTPFASGGQPFQVYQLKKDGINITDATSIVVQNFIAYQIALVFLGVIAVLWNQCFHLFKEVGLLKDLVTIGFIANTCIVILLLIIAYAKKTNKKLISFVLAICNRLHFLKNTDEIYHKFESAINRFHEGCTTLIHNRKLFATTIFYNLMALCSLYIIPLAIVYSMGFYQSFNGIEAIVSSAYVMLIGSFVPIPGGTGGLEFGFLQFYGNFLQKGVLSACMLIWRFVTYYFGMILGALALNIKGKED